MSYLLDSSAWLAHLFDEPGAEQVTLLFANTQNQVSISVLSIPEVHARLKSIARQAQWPDVWTIYSSLFTTIIPINEAIAHHAILLRAATPDRLPTIDSLIAATAVVHQLTLVHRDPHLAAVPASELHQMELPGKNS